MSEPDGVVVTVPVQPGETTSPVGGTDRDTCDRCGEDVWVSLGTRLSIEQGAYPETIWCRPCFLEAADE